MSTVFTQIIDGELPGTFVWRDDRCVAFLSINPLSPGHTLVVPIAEIDHWLDVPADLQAHLFEVSRRIGQAQMQALRPERIGLVVAGFEFDLPIVAALLTIAGYSVNDTVVICDRIRENMRKKRRDSMENIINTSINETLGRTILTTITSLLVLTALLMLGGGVIRPFAYTLFVGFLAGLYSTVFVATPIILLLERGRRR